MRSGMIDINRHTGESFLNHTLAKTQATYVLNEAIEDAEDGGSMKLHVLAVKLLPTQKIESSLAVIADYKAAYGRLPKSDITPFNLTSSVPPDLTKRLLDLGYNIYEHNRPRCAFLDSFSSRRRGTLGVVENPLTIMW